MDPNISYYGIVILLRKLRECGSFTEKELKKSPHGSLRITVLKSCFFSDFLHLSVAIWMQLW